jgi:drug/metabolite transporter (DMT)-like permease
MQRNRSNVGTLVVGVALILFGLLALSGQVFRLIDWGFLWPFLIIGLGALFFVAMFAGGKETAALAIPGSIIGGIGLVMLFQNITDRWESMSYFWTLIILFVGVGIYLMGQYAGNEEQKRSGWGVMRVGFILFIIFGAFFEMLIFSSSNSYIFPVLLILLGAYLVLSRSGLFGAKKIEEPTKTDSLPPAS